MDTMDIEWLIWFKGCSPETNMVPMTPFIVTDKLKAYVLFTPKEKK
jgi:hypothetical protein